MKKIFLLWVLIVPFIFSSCGNDNDEPKNPGEAIIGEWLMLDDDGKMPNPADDEVWHMEFFPNYDVKEWVTHFGVTTEQHNYGWQLSDGKLYIKKGSQSFPMEIKGGVLTIYYSDYTEQYKKLK